MHPIEATGFIALIFLRFPRRIYHRDTNIHDEKSDTLTQMHKKREWRAIFMCYPHNWELKQMELHTHKRKHIVKKRVTSGSKNRSVRFIFFILYIFLLLVCARQNVRALVHFAIHAFFVGWFIVFMIPPTQKIILPYSHHCVYLLCSTRADLFFLHRHSVIFYFHYLIELFM